MPQELQHRTAALYVLLVGVGVPAGAMGRSKSGKSNWITFNLGTLLKMTKFLTLNTNTESADTCFICSRADILSSNCLLSGCLQ